MKKHSFPPTNPGQIALGAAAMLGIASVALAQATTDLRPNLPPPPFLPDVKTVATDPGVKAAPEAMPPRTPITPNAPKPAVPAGLAQPDVLTQTLAATVLFDEPGDGRLWARGAAYKASFGPEGFTYIPFLGSDAPRNFPVSFALSSVTVGGQPVAFDAAAAYARQGARVSFDRGGFTEVYDLEPQSIEQSFVIDQPQRGEIVIEMAATSELAGREAAGKLEFGNDLGRVDYTQAIAVDAAGTRTNLATDWNNGRITIRVPRETVDAAAYPLVIDPRISTQSIEVGAALTRAADAAYDSTTARYNVVYQQSFSAADQDVWEVQRTSTGALVAGSLISVDFTTTSWTDPRVANRSSGDLFLTVAATGVAPNREIRGRTRTSGGNVQSAQIDISNVADTGDKHSPDVGGDPVGSNFMVVYTRVFTATDEDVHGRLVNGTPAATGGTILVDNTSATIDRRPCISKSCGGPGLWMVGWDRIFNATDRDIRGAVYNFNGAVTQASFSVDFSGLDDSAASVSSLVGANTFMFAYNRTASTIFGRVITGNASVASGSLTVIGGDPEGEAQQNPSIDTDGSKYILGYAEQFFGSDWDTYAQTFCVNGTSFTRAEGRYNLTFSGADERVIRLTTERAGGLASRDGLAVWNTGGATGFGDINAATLLMPLDCCPADIAPLGGNGVVNVDDLLAVINAWGGCTSCAADTNGDKQVNVDDLLSVINGWGACP